ncbi:MAG: ATP-binding protein, partial [Acidimicrobiia bacterium]
MGEGRRSGTATVLFTDLVGSTELMARLGDLAYDEVRSEHFRLLREVIAAHDGVEVKNTGDGLLATFGGAADAVRATVAIQQATDRHASDAGVPLSVRVGVALGDVTLEDADVFGTPVVEAARLVAAARPGQILVTAVVPVVAGSRSGATFTSLGSLELKGLPEPLPVCEVTWEPLHGATAEVPLPSLLASAGRIFVGRDELLNRLRQHWKEAQAGGFRLVLLGGEPGVGKTRLATELAHSLHAGGALVLGGRCDEDLGVPYQPFVEALRHYAHHCAPPRLGRHAGELARLVPELTQLVSGMPEPLRSDPETERYRLFDAVAAWLADASAETPVLLVIDDLQWAAKPTVQLLRHVARAGDPLRLLVVATYRDTDVGRGHPLAELLSDIPRLEGVERVPLTGLDGPAVAAFLEAAAGHELDEAGADLARVVWRETEGNAFFVAEMLRHLVESRAVEERGQRWALTAKIEDLGIPEGVRDVVGRRLSRLSEDANRVLACAAVVGLEFDPALVQAAGGFSEEAVLGALEEAVAARLLVDVPGAVPRNRFAHALVRATLYDELTAARRVTLHRHVAENIETRYAGRLDDHLPALAHHWAQAAAPAAETDRAVTYASRAGDRALAQLAHDEAATYYRS